MTRSPFVPGTILLGRALLVLAWTAKSGTGTKYAEPEDAAVANGVFQSDYFGLRYELPEGWVEDLKGPEPSTSRSTRKIRRSGSGGSAGLAPRSMR